jgi:glutathione synthase/RimK-type ligase-like ATP-grasp enzyme
VTNDPAAAREFVAGVGRAVYKPFGGAGVVDDDGVRQVFCTPIEPHECGENISRTMHLFQQWVPKAFEVRLTAVDEHLFAARIDGESEAAHTDWRSDYAHLSYSAVEVPDTVANRVRMLMRALNLRFGALDFVVSPDGGWTFLEVNANGQWAWIQDATGLPIAAALADALEARVVQRAA